MGKSEAIRIPPATGAAAGRTANDVRPSRRPLVRIKVA